MLSTLIKNNTAPSHARLEQALFAAAIMDGSFTISHYHTVLRVNYLVHHLLEPLIFSALGEELKARVSLAAREKLAALEKDMRGAGINVSEDHQVPVKVPGFTSELEALGALYVLEGATLGGQVINNRLKKNEAFAALPLAYYNIYAQRTGSMWKQFLDIINQYNDEDSALQGAQKVYKLYLEVAGAINKA